MLDFDTLLGPTLLLNQKKARNNLNRMLAKCSPEGPRLRPHFKTHQSAEVGEWFRSEGVEGITVSSIDMAVFFADQGWKDITIAFPVNIREYVRLNALAERIQVNVLLDSVSAVEGLGPRLETKVGAWLEVDIGDGRSGIPWQAKDRCVQVATSIRNAPQLELKGILGHGGYAYGCRGPAEILAVQQESQGRLLAVLADLKSAGFHHLKVSTGDTPTCSVGTDFSGIDEIRPGNFIFYDMMQLQIGACEEAEIAIAMACPVVMVDEEQNKAIVHGGGVHLSKDFLLNPDGSRNYGGIALPDSASGWTSLKRESFVSSLSQEHGVIHLGHDLKGKLRVGDLLMVLPIHSCMSVDLMRKYTTLEGKEIPCYHDTQTIIKQ